MRPKKRPPGNNGKKGIMYGQAGSGEITLFFMYLHVLCGLKSGHLETVAKRDHTVRVRRESERSRCFMYIHVLCGLKSGHLATAAKRDHVRSGSGEITLF
jgi:hypothetical protein